MDQIENKEYSKWDDLKKWIPSVIILPIALYFVWHRGTYSFIDNIDLVIHEAGHLFFFFLGRFIYTMGGTLMQIIIPSLLAWYFFRNEYKTGIQFSSLWLGQNLINISVYAADARAQKLHLLGGKSVYHDWHYMLGELGILNFDTEVGYFFYSMAILVFIVTLLIPLIIQD